LIKPLQQYIYFNTYHFFSVLQFCSASFCSYLAPLVVSSVQLFFYLFCSVLHLHSMHCASSMLFRSCSLPPSTRMHNYEKTPLFSVLHIFIMPSPLPDNSRNSSSSLAVILSLFVISGRYPEILWLLWQCDPSSSLLQLSFSDSYRRSSLSVTGGPREESPCELHLRELALGASFPHVTTGCDHSPTKKALHDFTHRIFCCESPDSPNSRSPKWSLETLAPSLILC
jgi:hypothetical protein